MVDGKQIPDQSSPNSCQEVTLAGLHLLILLPWQKSSVIFILRLQLVFFSSAEFFFYTLIGKSKAENKAL